MRNANDVKKPRPIIAKKKICHWATCVPGHIHTLPHQHTFPVVLYFPAHLWWKV